VSKGAKKATVHSGPVEGPWELPDGWHWDRLGDLGGWSGGGTPSKANPDFWIDGTVPWVSAKDMKSSYIDDTDDHITDAAVERSSAKRIPAGSVLCVMRSGILRHSFPVAVTLREVTINQDLRALKPRANVNPVFLAHFLKRTERDILHECSKDGTTVNSVDNGRLMSRPVPMPSRELQDRIVARIDELNALIDEGERRLVAAIGLIETYRRGLLRSAVAGDLTSDWRGEAGSREGEATVKSLPLGWRTAAFGEVAEVLSDGGLKLKERDYLRAGAIPVIDQGSRFIAGYTNDPALVQPHSAPVIIFGDHTRRFKFVNFQFCVGADGVKLIAARPSMSPRFLFLALQAAEFQDRGYSRHFQFVRALSFAVPPLKEQDEIVVRVDAAIALVEELGIALDAQRLAAAALRQSILAAAFRGELVK